MVPSVGIIVPVLPGPAATDLAHIVCNFAARSSGCATQVGWKITFVGSITPGQRALAESAADRFECLSIAGNSLAEFINRGVSASKADFVSVWEPVAFPALAYIAATFSPLAPTALSQLLTAASSAGTDAALCHYSFVSPLGRLPGNPLAGLGRGTVGVDELRRVNLAPLHAMVVRREVLEATPLEGSAAEASVTALAVPPAWQHRWLLRLAGAGLRWAVCPRDVATVPLAPPAPLAHVERDLLAHARLIASTDLPETELRSALLPFAEALALLRAHREDVDAARICAERAALIAGLPYSAGLFAQWWHRMHFLGPAPRHVLATSGAHRAAIGSPSASPQHTLAALATPSRIARFLVDQCGADRSAPSPSIILLGLGRNARPVARELASRGIPVIGRDDSLTGPPAWAASDGLQVRVLPESAPLDPAAIYIMTPQNDTAYLARIRERLPAATIHRWSAAAAPLAELALHRTLKELAELPSATLATVS